MINEIVKDGESKKVKAIEVVKEMCGDNATEREFDRFVDRLSSKYKVELFSLPKINGNGEIQSPHSQRGSCCISFQVLCNKREKYGKDVLQTLRTGFHVSAYDYVNAQRLRNLLSEEIVGAFAKYDLLASPTVTVWPPRIRDVVGQERKWVDRLTRNTSPFSMAGLPAISVPIAKDVGIQLIANSGEDLALLNFVHGLWG